VVRPRPQTPALFTVPERLGLAIAVLVLSAFLAMFLVVLDRGGSGGTWLLLDYLLALLPFTLPSFDDGPLVRFPLLVGGFALHCAWRLRRAPLAVTRNLWILAAAFYAFGLFYSLGQKDDGWGLAKALRSPWNMHAWYGAMSEATALPLAWALGLLTSVLAGELAHEARRRLQREARAEAESYSPRQAARLQRQQRLQQAVAGPAFPVCGAASRLLLLCVMPVGAVIGVGKFASAIRWMEHALPGPPIVAPESARAREATWHVAIEADWRVLVDGLPLAEPRDEEAPRLVEHLRAIATATPAPGTLTIDPEVSLQRILQVLDALRSAGLAARIVILEPPPPPPVAQPRKPPLASPRVLW